MTIPGSPQPEIVNLIKAIGAESFQSRPWATIKPEYKLRFYWHGRIALAAVIEAVRESAGLDSVQVWMPDYFCDEALTHLRRLPISIRFYPVTRNLIPDWQDMEAEFEETKTTRIFVLVHYFGFPNNTKEARAFCHQHGMVLIEDCAHVIGPHPEINKGDIHVFSPRKVFPVPSGSILVMPKDLEPFLVDRTAYPKEKGVLGWIMLRLIQKILIGLHISWHSWRPRSLGHADHDKANPPVYSCTSYTLKLLNIMESTSDAVTKKRRENYLRLESWVKGIENVRPFFPRLEENVCPFEFPLLLNEPNPKGLSDLEDWGIPAHHWPQLPPEILEKGMEGNTALWLREHLLFFPLHQGLGFEQMDYMGKALQRVFNRKN